MKPLSVIHFAAGDPIKVLEGVNDLLVILQRAPGLIAVKRVTDHGSEKTTIIQPAGVLRIEEL